MYVQLDNYAKDGKNKFVLACWSLLVANDNFKEVFVSLSWWGTRMMILIHLLGRWDMKLHEEHFPTIPYLMKSYMDLDNVPSSHI